MVADYSSERECVNGGADPLSQPFIQPILSAGCEKPAVLQRLGLEWPRNRPGAFSVASFVLSEGYKGAGIG
jgi:hypothetical protein